MDVLATATEIVQRYYGMEDITSVEPLPGRRHVFLISSAGSRYVLKCMPASEFRLESLRITHELVCLLNQVGFRTYSLIPTTVNHTWVSGTDLSWEMHTYLPGDVLESIALRPSLVGELLGEYHKATRALACRCPAPDRDVTAGGCGPADPRLPLKVLSSRVHGALAQEAVSQLVRLSESLVRESSASDLLLPLHGDISASNIIVSTSNSYLIDFEDTTWGDPCLDVAQAVARTISSVHAGSAACMAAVCELLSSYTESSESPPPPAGQLKKIAGLQAIRDWTCEQLCTALPDRSVHEALPLLQDALDSLSECVI